MRRMSRLVPRPGPAVGTGGRSPTEGPEAIAGRVGLDYLQWDSDPDGYPPSLVLGLVPQLVREGVGLCLGEGSVG